VPIDQKNLGLMYANGEGVDQDYKRAYVCLNIAASSLEGERRDSTVSYRDAEAAFLTPMDLADAQRIARDWTPGTPIKP